MTFLAADVGGIFWQHVQRGEWVESGVQGMFVLILCILLYGNLVYQFARLGYLKRLREHEQKGLEVAARSQNGAARRLAVLVPSYREEIAVIRMTLLSAALLDYGRSRVVLLIDDPVETSSPEERASLEATRRLPSELQRLLTAPATRVAEGHANFSSRARLGDLDLASEAEYLAKLCDEVAQWFRGLASVEVADSHAQACFERLVSEHGAERLEASARSLRAEPPTRDDLVEQYEALDERFRVEFCSFERKRYVNLSHTPNKAMNLNSYLGLVGGSYREVERENGLHLEEAPCREASLSIPDVDYVLTLDADSLLRTDYARRLVDFMEQPGHERLAVVQTPYSAFPGATSPIERIAGATTDIQYIIHQGFTHYAATYWVGANALLRMTALRELHTTAEERGFAVSKFISDETVIEDTESSIDFVARGWQLHNYPERMAYSATPADFGSLAIQRMRWANGGLLILPKLLRYVGSRLHRAEALMRGHYLASIAGVNLALVVLLLTPFDSAQRSWWLPLAAAPYFALYAMDLRSAGYRASDVLRVYALNLLLIPVNIEGVLASLRQALTGRKTAFRRTPKVSHRTPAEPRHLWFHAALLVALTATFSLDLARGLWIHASFVAVNGSLLAYAMWRFLGPEEFRDFVEARRAALRIPSPGPQTSRRALR
jgi:cellulose synthase (UDP-forming)